MESIPFVSLSPVTPVKPVAAYIGGKRALAKRLVARIATIPHDLYAEPFVGMGGVFFRRQARPRMEVINDVAQDVTTLFRILQRHYQPFIDTLKWRLSSRAEFERLLRVDASTLTDLERAARFLYLQRTAFGGKVVGRTYGVDRARSRFNLATLEPMLDDIHDRMQGVVIERLPYADFIRRYDRPGTLFYLDPPYFGCEGDYGDAFSPADFECLAKALSGLQGTFLMSLNDHPDVRSIFADFALEQVETTYQIGPRPKPVTELIISPKQAVNAPESG